MITADNSVAGVVGVVRDITRLKEAESALEAERERLSAAMEELQEELNIASGILRMMLPDCARPFPGFSVAVHFRPCQVVGGDFYDIIPIDASHTALLIVDILGHGVPAALVTALVKVSFANQARVTNRPNEILQAINRTICDSLSWRSSLTAFLGIFDAAKRTLSYSRAGHPRPLFLRHGSAECEELEAKGAAIGLSPQSRYELREVGVNNGDTMLFFTDGVTECQNGNRELFGKDRLKEILVREPHLDPEGLVAAVRTEQEAHLGGAVQNDDITLLVAKAG
jgi:sigma-B regulation protein RsbU (phosphoserine phosphatase)